MTDSTRAPPNPYKDPSSSSKSTNKTKEKFEYEFGGPVGALGTMVSLPLVTLALTHFASIGHIPFADLLQRDSDFWNVTVVNSFHQLFDYQYIRYRLGPCLIGTLAWFLFQVFLQRVLPCELIQGAILPHNTNAKTNAHENSNGTNSADKRLTYRINGHLAFWVTLLLLEFGWPYFHQIPIYDDDGSATSTTTSILQFGRAPLHYLYDYYTELALASIIWCSILSFYLYLRTILHDDLLLAKGGQSGNPIYDFFIGKELNPRPFPKTSTNTSSLSLFDPMFDWKQFCELRPGLIGWTILNLSFLSTQHQKLGYVSGSMMLINIFQFFYVWDALYQERAILTTMDITTDGFGFMLVFGDMAWVPFTYSLQARYLVDYDPGLSVGALGAVLLTNFVGYGIFRGANSQKDAFRRDPNGENVKHLQYLQTKRGTRLLTSGWWGMARKINYTGDWIMGLSWCLLCGFGSIVPYFYAIYFCILLIHRSIRDDHMCQEKYGDDWNAYKKHVPYRFVPGVV